MRKSQDFQIKGNFNYHLDFQVKGGIAPFQTCILSANAFSKADKRFAIAIKCTWSRIRGSRSYGLLGINSNTYQLSAQDIGSVIEVEAVPQEEGFKGSAIISFGPVLLDPSVKVTLEGILAAGGSKFPINLVQEDSGVVLKDSASVLLTNDYVRVVWSINDREEKSLKFRYNLEEPEIEMNNLDTTMLAMNFRGVFEEDMPLIMKFLHENRLNVGRNWRFAFKTVSKTSRDLVYLALKCFAAKSFLLDSKLISSIESVFTDGKLFSNKVNKTSTLGDFLLEVEGVKKEVSYLLKHNQELVGDKEHLANEVKSLENELSETIEAYSQAIMELKTSGNAHDQSVMLEMSIVGRKDEIFYRNEVKKLTEEKKKLIERITLMNEELELNRHFNKNEGFFSESRIWTKNDEEKIGFKKNKEDSRILQSPNKDLEAALMNVTELKVKNQMLESKLAEMKVAFEKASATENLRNSGGNNLRILETKLQETKKLNEMLLSELNELRKKATTHNSSGIEQQVTTLSHQYQQKCSELAQSESEKEQIISELEVLKVKFATGEAELHEMRKKNEFLEGQKFGISSHSETIARFENEKLNQTNEIFALRSKTTKLELDAAEFQRKKDSLESQLRTTKSRSETLEFENQVLRKELESLKSRDKPSENLSSQIKASDVRFMELKSKYDLLLSEHEQLKVRMAESGERSFRVEGYFPGDGNQFRLENERLKMEVSGLMKRNEDLIRNMETLRSQIPGEGGKSISNNSALVQEHKIKSLQKLLEDSCAVNEKNLKEINALKRENQDMRNELELLRKGNYQSNYNSNKINDTSFMLNRTVVYEIEAENESLKHKLSSLELMVSDYKAKFAMLQAENDALKREESGKMLNRTVVYEIEADYESMKQRLSSLELMLSDYKTKFAMLQAENDTLKRESGKMLNRTVVYEIEADNESMKQRLSSLELMLSDYKNKFAMLQAENDTLKREESGKTLNRTVVYEIEAENESMKRRLSSLELMVSDYKSKFAMLQAENDSLKKESSSGKKLKLSGDSMEADLLKSRLATNELLINDYKIKLEQAYAEVNSLRNENVLLKAEIEELSKSNPLKTNLSSNLLNRSFREGSSGLNRTFQVELEIENETLKKNLSSMEGMLQDYKTNVRSYFEKTQLLEKQIADLQRENQGLRVQKPGNNASFMRENDFSNENNKQLLAKIEELKKESRDNTMVFESLKSTNQRLLSENNRLMEMVRRTQDEVDGLKSRSRIVDSSFMGDLDVISLRERVAELQRENEMISNEKDKLLVELSKLMAQQ